MTSEILDRLKRPLRDLRISVTDRCNFRCVYCMPKHIFKDHDFLPHNEVLTFEEITRLVGIFVSLGTRKIRLTGGEPLVRRDLETLVRMVASVDGLEDLAMTTNGSFPTNRIDSLKTAGLKRMTVSLDSLDDQVFTSMNDVGVPVERVLNWIDSSVQAGFKPVKVNMVVKKSINRDSILPMARFFNTPNTILRFIEYMDVGTSNGWQLDEVIPARQVLEMINAEMPLEPIDENYHGEVAERYRYCDTGNEIGIIASVTQPFCQTCTRIRLSANGSLYTCLFSNRGHDLKSLLRSDASDEHIRQSIIDLWSRRTDRYSEIRSEATADLPKVEMSFIGG